MGGITSASMPMLVVENVTDGNRAYCNLNEGFCFNAGRFQYGSDLVCVAVVKLQAGRKLMQAETTRLNAVLDYIDAVILIF